MKILVFSDSHGHYERLRRAVRGHLGTGGIDRIFFLGDGIRDIVRLSDEFPKIPINYVHGNCDDAFTTKAERENAVYEEVVTVGGVTFLLMHGHKYDVKYSTDDAAFRAYEVGADVLLYGHTHRADDSVADFGNRKIRVINPGAVSSYERSYALLNVVCGEVVCGFGEI